MEMLTTRVELGGGEWAELYVEVKQVTSRLHEAEVRKHVRPLEDEPLLMSELSAGQKPWPSDGIVNAAAVDQSRVAEIYALYQVKAWSLGPVDQQTIDDLPKKLFNRLREEIDKLYDVPPLPGSAVGS